ncbi:MAG: nucleoside-triphosphatase [Saprospiraceae bacterium]
MILILTGPVRSLKTTTLYHWAMSRQDCGGFLTPDDGGMRMMYNVKDKKTISFQKTERTSDADVVIGRFVFDGEVFKTATTWLDNALADPAILYIILDEVGPLELNGGGWDLWIRSSLKKMSTKTLILVVRHSLLNEVIRHYDLKDAQIELTGYFLGL